MAYDWSFLDEVTVPVGDTQQEAPDEVEGGFLSSLIGGTVGGSIKGIGQAASDFIPGVSNDNSLKQYGQEIAEDNPVRVRNLEDIASNPFTAVMEATGSAVGSMGAMLGAKATGSAITALAPAVTAINPIAGAATATVGQLVSWLGPIAAKGQTNLKRP